jgi:hypothetical protein
MGTTTLKGRFQLWISLNNANILVQRSVVRVGLRLDRLSNQWILEILHGAHNHGPSKAPTAHPAHRAAAITPATRTQIGSLSHTGLTISQILSTLRSTNPGIPLIAKDISNIVQLNRAEQLNGRTPIQSLLEVL